MSDIPFQRAKIGQDDRTQGVNSIYYLHLSDRTTIAFLRTDDNLEIVGVAAMKKPAQAGYACATAHRNALRQLDRIRDKLDNWRT